MRRTPADILITVVLAAYGLYAASYIPGLLVAPVPPILLISRILEAVFGFAAAVGVWNGERWAPLAILALGLTIAVMWLVEAFVLGIVAYLNALAAAVIVAILFMAGAFYVQGHRHPAHNL